MGFYSIEYIWTRTTGSLPVFHPFFAKVSAKDRLKMEMGIENPVGYASLYKPGQNELKHIYVTGFN